MSEITAEDVARLSKRLADLHDDRDCYMLIHPDSELGREVYAGWSESERRAIRRWMNEQRSKLARGE